MSTAVDWIVPKYSTTVSLNAPAISTPTITSGTVVASVITTSTIAGSVITTPQISAGSFTSCVATSSSFTGMSVGSSTITGSVFNTGTILGSPIATGTVTGASLVQTDFSCTVTNLKNTSGGASTVEMPALITSIGNIVTLSLRGFAANGAGSSLAISPVLAAGLWPIIDQYLPVHIDIPTGGWGLLKITSSGVMTLYATANLGVFTDTQEARLYPSTVTWNTVAFT